MSTRGREPNRDARRPRRRVAGQKAASSEAAVALPAVLQTFASIVAPTTLITALLFYYGRLHAQAQTRYLRVHFTVLDLSPQDYLVRSADGLFVPLSIALIATVGVVWAHRLLVRPLLDRGDRRRIAVLTTSAALVGLISVTIAVATVLGGLPPSGFPEAGGLALSVSVVLLAYAVHLTRSTRLSRGAREPRRVSGIAFVEWGAIFVLFSVGLFWAVNSYALGVGTSRGQQIERELPSSPDVVLYSEKDLGLNVPGVGKVACSLPRIPSAAADRFRYDGLKLVLQSGGHYLFLPATWNRSDGVGVLVPRTDALSLEFWPPGRAARSSC